MAFEKTKEFAWLQANAYKYGFILSYPKGNAYYAYEPWHWRFVGKGLAGQLHRDNLAFITWIRGLLTNTWYTCLIGRSKGLVYFRIA